MSYYLSLKPDDYCPIEEREQKIDEILDSIQQDDVLFLEVENEVYNRRGADISLLHFKAYNGVDIRKELDKLFEKVVTECLEENINYFGGE